MRLFDIHSLSLQSLFGLFFFLRFHILLHVLFHFLKAIGQQIQIFWENIYFSNSKMFFKKPSLTYVDNIPKYLWVKFEHDSLSFT